MKVKWSRVIISLILLFFITGCSIRKKIDNLKDKGEEGIPKLERIALTQASAFIRIAAIYALGEIKSVKAVSSLIRCYKGISEFLHSRPESIKKDYLKRTGMHFIELSSIDYAMREACFDGISKHFIVQDGFFYSYNKQRIRPKYKVVNKEDKDIIIPLLFKVVKDADLEIVYDSGKGLRYRAAYLLQRLDVRYAIPEIYFLLKNAFDTETKREILNLLFAFGDIQYFPLNSAEKEHMQKVKEEINELTHIS